MRREREGNVRGVERRGGVKKAEGEIERKRERAIKKIEEDRDNYI